MRSAGIRELKRSTSTYLRQVPWGEKILITDRKKLLAVISAVENNRENEIIKQLAETGLAHWTGGKPSGAGPRIHAKAGVLAAVLEGRR